MAIVSHIEERRGLIYIDADGRRLCAVKKRFFQKMPVSEGDVLDEEAYLDRLSSLQLNAAYEEALSLLDVCARATGEMRKKLSQKGYLEPAVDAVIERMTQNHLLNDEDYAERIVQSGQGKSMGYYAIKRKLRSKGVDEDAVEQALDLVDDEEQKVAARALAEKLSRKYHGQEWRIAKGKISQSLARKGFSWDVISSALDGLEDGFSSADWDD